MINISYDEKAVRQIEEMVVKETAVGRPIVEGTLVQPSVNQKTIVERSVTEDQVNKKCEVNSLVVKIMFKISVTSKKMLKSDFCRYFH